VFIDVPVLIFSHSALDPDLRPNEVTNTRQKKRLPEAGLEFTAISETNSRIKQEWHKVQMENLTEL
jgi:hypothetical protein